MNIGPISVVVRRWLLAGVLGWSFAAVAFPPVPPHQIYGLVRDRIGNPLDGGAVVILEASSGVKIRGDVGLQKESGVNFRIDVPMDAGLTADVYRPTALQPTAPFRLRVQVGSVIYLPMEMTGDASRLGLPGQKTRFELTLGVDADGNGLPDDWEKAVAAYLRQRWVAGAMRPDDAYPGTGMTYRQVYLAGVYAMAPKEGLALSIVPRAGRAPTLAFTAVKGRTYSIQGAASVGQWSPVAFRVAGSTGVGTDSDPVLSYFARDTRQLEVEVPAASDEGAGASAFFRLMVE